MQHQWQGSLEREEANPSLLGFVKHVQTVLRAKLDMVREIKTQKNNTFETEPSPNVFTQKCCVLDVIASSFI